MPDADLYRVTELPSDDIGGGSGDKRKFLLEFIGKTPNERFPYTVANEVVSNFIGTVLGFNIPAVIPHRIGDDQFAMVLWMRPASRSQNGPPLTSKALKEFVDEHSDIIHGAIILDLYLANSDRALGPTRRNISVDEYNSLTLFDFGNALFYRNREHLGVIAGVPRLDRVEVDLRAMFDKPEPDPESYYFQLLTDWQLIEKWCKRVGELPDFLIETAVARIPYGIDPPSFQERERLIEFLKNRRYHLMEQIERNIDLFPGLAPRGIL